MKNITRWLMAVTAVALLAALFTGCNTARGAGRDIERAGEKVQDVAD